MILLRMFSVQQKNHGFCTMFLEVYTVIGKNTEMDLKYIRDKDIEGYNFADSGD